jgi:hypothetical protein
MLAGPFLHVLVETAVRETHLPDGILRRVSCERSSVVRSIQIPIDEEAA